MGGDGGDDIQSGGEDDGVDDFSDVSDDSDLFHVEAKVVDEPRTDEDREMAIVDSIAPHLRDHPLLPPDGRDTKHQVSFGIRDRDMKSCHRFPVLHCGFKGCNWTCNRAATRHWDLERFLCVHLDEERRQKEYNDNADVLAGGGSVWKAPKTRTKGKVSFLAG